MAPRFERFLQIGYRRFVFIEDTEASIDRIVSALHQKKKKKRIYWNICNIGGIIGTTRSRNRFLADNFYFHSIKFSSTKFYYENIINQNEHPSKRISVTLLLLLSSRIFPKGKNPRGIIAWNEARSRMETERKTRWGREEGDRFVISFSSSRGFRLGLLMNSD